MGEHTPTPWKVVSRPEFHNGLTYTSIQPVTPEAATMRPLLMASGEHHVCRMSHTAARHAIDLHQANAAFIVKAVNNHDALVGALTELYAQVRGECPSLLNEDSGGDGTLDLEIRTLLASVETVGGSGK